nr:immunoglobulin light chain junction region [Macaca mulatta]MOW39043.1 immunoglobulin light chain junction region [Macaca mulatta]MOW39045.1 immunoglobulin light chain junction region [Macaca mulatta]MOW39048.1 immunoglobulin light chain junction region [Macaca mulatta]MOW39057.1 immunoglobulin light chain junction region [Macaca mulatta]
CQQETDWSLTF